MVLVHLSGKKTEQGGSCILFSDTEPKFRKVFLRFLVKLDISLQAGECGESRILHPEIQSATSFKWEEEEEIMSSETKRDTERSKQPRISTILARYKISVIACVDAALQCRCGVEV